MQKCGHCGAETFLIVNSEPLCLECKAELERCYRKWLKELREAQDEARMEVERALIALQPLTELLYDAGVTPPGWDAQNESVKVAVERFQLARAKYLEALCGQAVE